MQSWRTASQRSAQWSLAELLPGHFCTAGLEQQRSFDHAARQRPTSARAEVPRMQAWWL